MLHCLQIKFALYSFILFRCPLNMWCPRITVDTVLTDTCPDHVVILVPPQKILSSSFLILDVKVVPNVVFGIGRGTNLVFVMPHTPKFLFCLISNSTILPASIDLPRVSHYYKAEVPSVSCCVVLITSVISSQSNFCTRPSLYLVAVQVILSEWFFCMY